MTAKIMEEGKSVDLTESKENMVATIERSEHMEAVRKMKTRIKVTKHRQAVSRAEGMVRQWAWWIKHQANAKQRPPMSHEMGHDDDLKPVTSRAKGDPQKLDPRFESYLAVEAFVKFNGGWMGNQEFLFRNAKKRYPIVLSGLHTNPERKEWFRGTILGIAQAIKDGDEVLNVGH